MKALVVFENHFFLDSNHDVWCDRIVDYPYLQRYLNVFDSIVLMGRTQIVSAIEGKKLLVSGRNVVFVPIPDFKGAKGLILHVFELKKLIQKQAKKCDCVIYRAPTHLSLFTYKEVVKMKKVLILEFVMAADKMFDGNSLLKKVLNLLVDKRAKKMCMQADAVSYVTDHILQESYPCKAIVHPGDKRYFTESYSSIDLEKDIYYSQKWNKNEKPDVFRIVHTGYMDSYRKGQDVLIKAFKILVDRGHSVHLTLIGDGEKKSKFEELVKYYGLEDKVEFKGLVKDKSIIFDCLRDSHFFVFPTQSEGLPRTVIEAMSQGLVCISSPVDGIPELLDDEFLIDYYDVDGYANKIEEMMNHWDRCCVESTKNYQKSLSYEKSILEKKRNHFYSKVKGLIKNEK